ERTRAALPRDGARVLELRENAVDLELWAPRPRAPAGEQPLCLAFSGRLVRTKGVALLLRALERVPPRSCRLLIVGDGPERAALEALARAAGDSLRVEFKGWLSPQECAACLASCDVLVHPALNETSGTVLLEAL